MDIHNKLDKLKSLLMSMGSLAVAYSGGVDSTFLLKVAHDVLKDKVVAITVKSHICPERELDEAENFAKALKVKHIVIVFEQLDIEGFSDNPVNRCYICKKALFTKLHEISIQNGMQYIVDGSNVDDLDDYRPGMIALKELGVVSPLREAELTKNDIRELSKEMNLPTWDKPAMACLASRIPYGQEITKEKLEMIDKSEQYLIDIGFKQVRVRYHGDIARIEVSNSERSRFFNEDLMDKVHDKLKEFGFEYVAMDLKGYRTGSMNEVIGDEY